MLEFDIDTEKKLFFWGQKLLLRGNPIRYIGKVKRGNNGALRAQAAKIRTITNGKKLTKFKIIKTNELLRRCFFIVQLVMLIKMKVKHFWRN